jgi:hypothetical protein
MADIVQADAAISQILWNYCYENPNATSFPSEWYNLFIINGAAFNRIKASADDFRKNHEAPKIPDEIPPPPPFDDKTNAYDYLEGKGPNYEGGGGDGDIQINTDDLRSFSKFLSNFEPPLRELQTRINNLSVSPGAFYQAYHLRQSIHSDTGLGPATLKVIDQSLDTITHIQKAITEMIAEYDTIEELNSMTSEQFTKYVSQVKTIVNQLNS